MKNVDAIIIGTGASRALHGGAVFGCGQDGRNHRTSKFGYSTFDEEEWCERTNEFEHNGARASRTSLWISARHRLDRRHEIYCIRGARHRSACCEESVPGLDTVTVGADEPIPNLPGKRLATHVVEYAPGGGSAPHRHARSAFIYAYVISGEIRSQVDGEPVHFYRAGESWFERSGSRHPVSVNASNTKPARLLAVVIVDDADKQLTIPDAQ